MWDVWWLHRRWNGRGHLPQLKRWFTNAPLSSWHKYSKTYYDGHPITRTSLLNGNLCFGLCWILDTVCPSIWKWMLLKLSTTVVNVQHVMFSVAQYSNSEYLIENPLTLTRSFRDWSFFMLDTRAEWVIGGIFCKFFMGHENCLPKFHGILDN